MEQDRIRVGLVDDHRAVRDAIRDLLASEPDIDAVGEAGTRSGALDLAERTRPDVLLLDVQLPDGSGLTAIRELLTRLPGLRIVILTMFKEPRFRSEAMKAGASDYVLKDSPPQEMLEAVRSAARR